MRGGKRPGAGRPKGSDRRMVSFRLPNWLCDWLKAKAETTRNSQAKIIEGAIKALQERERR
jgi:hypothetical protein